MAILLIWKEDAKEVLHRHNPVAELIGPSFPSDLSFWSYECTFREDRPQHVLAIYPTRSYGDGTFI
jgi:hypothetical protein